MHPEYKERHWRQHKARVITFGGGSVGHIVQSTDGRIFVKLPMDWANQQTWLTREETLQLATRLSALVLSHDMYVDEQARAADNTTTTTTEGEQIGATHADD
jgi:hypothetical protein